MTDSEFAFLFALAILGFIYWVLVSIKNWFVGLFTSGRSRSYGGGYSGGGDEFVLAIQRGRQIEVKRANGGGSFFDGELRGWSSTAVSFVDNGRSGVYHSDGSYSYYS